jgi:uncharacterized protein (DUF433 family)
LDEILENFPRLTAMDVDAAVAFENQRGLNGARPVQVRG